MKQLIEIPERLTNASLQTSLRNPLMEPLKTHCLGLWFATTRTIIMLTI